MLPLPQLSQTNLCTSSNVRSRDTFWLFPNPEFHSLVRHERVRSIRPQSRSRHGRDVATSVEQILLGNGCVCFLVLGDRASSTTLTSLQHFVRRCWIDRTTPPPPGTQRYTNIRAVIPSLLCSSCIHWRARLIRRPFHLHRHSSFMDAYAYLYGCEGA
jgi:hypothetical protein